MTRPTVGNDIVDLSDPRCHAKAQDARFVARVFTSDEAERIRSAPSPNRTLWLLWAAKEAAYKVVSKLGPGPPAFVHARFLVRPEVEDGEGAGGIVEYGRWRVRFIAELTSHWIHTVGWSGPAPWNPDLDRSTVGLHWEVIPVAEALKGEASVDLVALRTLRFSDRERLAVHSLPSAAVRIAARRHAARVLGVAVEDLEVVSEGGKVGRSPPFLLHRGSAASADVSLSHHGELVAWALGVGTTGAAGS